MINITYTKEIKITTGDFTGIFKPEQLPLTFQIKNCISKKIIWETKLHSFMWAIFPETELKDVVIIDAQGNFISQYRWDLMEHGSVFYKSLWLYCKSLINSGHRPKGLVIGTHDGEFGEWVPLVRNYMSDMILVEASENQFNRLKENYEGKQGVLLMRELVTTDGKEAEFFEGGRGYTNTVVKRVIDYWEKEVVTSSKRTSISINDLILNYFISKNTKLDWLHLDVEGLDAKLIMSIEKGLLPNFIIYEDFNLQEDERKELQSYLNSQGYHILTEQGISKASR